MLELGLNWDDDDSEKTQKFILHSGILAFVLANANGFYVYEPVTW